MSAHNLRERRERLGKSQDDVVRSTGLSKSTVRRLDAGGYVEGAAAGLYNLWLQDEERGRPLARPLTKAEVTAALIENMTPAEREEFDEAHRRQIYLKQEREGLVREQQRQVAAGLIRPAPARSASVDDIRKSQGTFSFGPQGSLPASHRPEDLVAVLEPVMQAENLTFEQAWDREHEAADVPYRTWLEKAAGAASAGVRAGTFTPPKKPSATPDPRLLAAKAWAIQNKRDDLLEPGQEDALLSAYEVAMKVKKAEIEAGQEPPPVKTAPDHPAQDLARPAESYLGLLRAARAWAEKHDPDLLDGGNEQTLIQEFKRAVAQELHADGQGSAVSQLAKAQAQRLGLLD